MHAPHDGLVCPYSPHVLVLNRHGSTWRGWRLRGMHMHGGRCFRGCGEGRPTSDDVDRCGRCSTRRRRRRISVPLPRCRCPGSRSLTLVPSSLGYHSNGGGWGAPLSAFSFTHKNGDISNGQTFWRGGGDPADGEDSKAVSASLFQTFNFSIHSAVSAPSLSMSVCLFSSTRSTNAKEGGRSEMGARMARSPRRPPPKPLPLSLTLALGAPPLQRNRDAASPASSLGGRQRQMGEGLDTMR